MEPATLLAINGVFAAVPDLRALIDAQAATIAGLRAALRGLLTFCPADTETQDRLVLAARAATTRQP